MVGGSVEKERESEQYIYAHLSRHTVVCQWEVDRLSPIHGIL